MFTIYVTLCLVLLRNNLLYPEISYIRLVRIAIYIETL